MFKFHYKVFQIVLALVSDSDIKSYIKTNSTKYQQISSRTIEYVVFNVNPSEDDKNDAKIGLQNIKSEFTEVDDDELFIRKYSDIFNPFNVRLCRRFSEKLGLLMESAVGTIVGPFKLNLIHFKIS